MWLMVQIKSHKHSPILYRVWAGGRVYAGLLIFLAVVSWGLDAGAPSRSMIVWIATSLFVLVFSRGASLGSTASAMFLLPLGLASVFNGVLYWLSGALTGLPGILLQTVSAVGGIWLSVLAAKAISEIRKQR